MKTNKEQQKSAYSYGIFLLSHRGYSVQELTAKMQRQGYTEVEQQEAVAKLSYYGFLDDLALAKAYYRKFTASGKYGAKLIGLKLKQKGFSDSIIESCFDDYDQETALAQAVRLLERRYKKLEDRETAPMYRYLAARGFSSELIRKAIELARQET
ncbi:MAG: regulatory protein RecX [Sporomusaceae bacterium]|nr:regulatory protein RecX [Sporomusaceae bacterium]